MIFFCHLETLLPFSHFKTPWQYLFFSFDKSHIKFCQRKYIVLRGSSNDKVFTTLNFKTFHICKRKCHFKFCHNKKKWLLVFYAIAAYRSLWIWKKITPTYIEGMVNWCFSQGFCGFLAKYCLYFHCVYKWIEDTWHENQSDLKLIVICQSYCKILIRNRWFFLFKKKSSLETLKLDGNTWWPSFLVRSPPWYCNRYLLCYKQNTYLVTCTTIDLWDLQTCLILESSRVTLQFFLTKRVIFTKPWKMDICTQLHVHK